MDTTYVYDPALGGWSLIDPLPTAPRALDAAVISDTIYMIGGVGQAGAGFSNEGYGDFKMISTTTASLQIIQIHLVYFKPLL